MAVEGDQVCRVDVDDNVGQIVKQTPHDEGFGMCLERPGRAGGRGDEERKDSGGPGYGGGGVEDRSREPQAELQLPFAQIRDLVDEDLAESKRRARLRLDDQRAVPNHEARAVVLNVAM